MAHLWLRDEVKPGERRTAIPPNSAKELINEGYIITVEKSKNRVFTDKDYEAAGCTLVESGTWKNAPIDTYIVGLKELPEETTPLKHKHIYFAHCFKQQSGWKDLLNRFYSGNGTLLDLEFLVDENGRRVAAFGKPAGLAGAALGILLWVHKQLHPGTPFPAANPWDNQAAMIEDIKAALAKVDRKPTFIVIGALGRCGQGVVEVLKQAGIDTNTCSLWDLAETTQKLGPYEEILNHDIFVNCIYLSSAIPPFITPELIARHDYKLSVIVDVSCDVSNPYNPVPVCKENTTLLKPTLKINTKPDVDLISIDNLPTLLPRESSLNFSKDLLPSMISLKDKSPVWHRAENLYNQKVQSLKQD